MGTVVDTQVDEGKDNEESDFRNIGASDPVVYQLVRVFVCIAFFLKSFENGLLSLYVDVVYL